MRQMVEEKNRSSVTAQNLSQMGNVALMSVVSTLQHRQSALIAGQVGEEDFPSTAVVLQHQHNSGILIMQAFYYQLNALLLLLYQSAIT